MNLKVQAAFLFGVVLSAHSYSYQQPSVSDNQIRQKIIQQSIASYRGSCPCPYSVARNGSSCGGRSAYSKAGGYQPKCYPRDVTDAEVKRYRGVDK